ncbi:MAG TPA: globin family protein [Verrucomicrobiae bacterium]|nr:globin family protein [Verrucomicrobiae bacterium]
MITENQIQLIRQTFALVAPKADVAALIFYRRLFELDPSLRPLFRTDIEQQAVKLMQMLTAAVRLLDRPQTLVPVLEDLGRRHVGYGVRDEHYETVGAALLWMLSETLAEHFTSAAHDAWANLYTLVATTMKRAAADVSPLIPMAHQHRETMAVGQ